MYRNKKGQFAKTTKVMYEGKCINRFVCDGNNVKAVYEAGEIEKTRNVNRAYLVISILMGLLFAIALAI